MAHESKEEFYRQFRENMENNSTDYFTDYEHITVASGISFRAWDTNEGLTEIARISENGGFTFNNEVILK